MPALPTVVCQIAPGVDPFTTPAGGDWVTLGKVESLKTDTGREREEGRVKAGTGRLVVRNEDRALDPLNTSSAYYPDLIPNVRLRIVATWAAVDYELYTGFVEDWPQIYESSFSAKVNLDASDAFALFAAEKLPTSVWAFEVLADTPSAWWRLGDSGQAVDSSGHALDGQYQAESGSPASTDALVAGDTDKAHYFAPGQRVSLPYKNLITGFPFTLEAWIRTAEDRAQLKIIFDGEKGPGNETSYLQFGIVDSSTSAISAGRAFALIGGGSDFSLFRSNQYVDDGAVHHIVWVATSATSWKLYVDGVDETINVWNFLPAFPKDLDVGYAIGNTPALAIGDYSFDGDIDEVVLYNGVAMSGARVTAHYEAGAIGWNGQSGGERIDAILDQIGFSATDRDIDGGNSALVSSALSGSVLDYLQKVAESEDGLLFMDGAGKVRFRERHALYSSPYNISQGTFGDTDAEILYEDVVPAAPARFIRNDVRVKPENGTPQSAVDTTSRDRYGPRTYERGPLMITTNEAIDQGAHLLSRYKDPHTRFTKMVLEPAGIESTLFPQVLGRKMGDRITVVRRPVGGGPTITLPCHIEGVSHECDGRKWRTTWALSPADTAPTPWILGTSALNSGTRLGY